MRRGAWLLRRTHHRPADPLLALSCRAAHRLCIHPLRLFARRRGSRASAVEGVDKVALLLRTACPALNRNRRLQQASLAKSLSSFVRASNDPWHTPCFMPHMLLATTSHQPRAHREESRHQSQGDRVNFEKLANPLGQRKTRRFSCRCAHALAVLHQHSNIVDHGGDDVW